MTNYRANLFDAFRQKELILFIGPEISVGAGLPSLYSLVSELASNLNIELPPTQWLTFDILIDTVQAYVNEWDLSGLIRFLKRKLDTTQHSPSDAHYALAKFPISMVFTVNHDNLLERAYQKTGKRVHIVVRDEDIPFMLNEENSVNIIKLYGDLDQPRTIVLAREQIEKFFVERPQITKLLETQLGRSSVLYLGWNYKDPLFNFVFGELLSRFSGWMRPGFAVMRNVSEQQNAELKRKQIHLVKLPPGEDYGTQLATWLNNMRLSWEKMSMNTEKKDFSDVKRASEQKGPALNQTLLLESTESKKHKDPLGLFEKGGLCAAYPLDPSPNEYFVAHETSPEKIADLRQALVQGMDFTNLKPYTADQDIHPGHILCKIAAKIQTTAFCIFDLPESQNRNVYLELGIAIGLGRPFVLIKSAEAQVPSLVQGLDHFGFTSYTGLRREVGERVQVGQFSTILPQENILPADSYFVADGEFEQGDFREALRIALESYELQPVYMIEGQVGPQLALTQLVRNIQAARFGVYRVDERASANTFLALGIAIGLNKPWLLVARESASIPQDIRGLSHFNFQSFQHLEKDFVERCEAFVQRYAVGKSASQQHQPSGSDTDVDARKSEVHSTVKLKTVVKESSMPGIPSDLGKDMREALLECDIFEENSQVSALFTPPTSKLRPWRYSVPQRSTRAARVDAVIDFLADKGRSDTHENALVLFLRILSGRIDSGDALHSRLAEIANRLEAFVGGGTVEVPTTSSMTRSTGPQVTREFLLPPGPVRNRWALLVGINRYIDPSITPLNFCVNDVVALEEILHNLKYTVVILHDDASEAHRQPTKDNVEAELQAICDAAEPDDLIWAHFACHGQLVEGNPVLMMQQTRLRTLIRSGMILADVERRMRDSKARRRVITLDACHSGVDIGRGGVDPEFNRYVHDLAEGFALIAAGTAQQKAQEWREKQHGVFTYYLLEGLSGKADEEGKQFVTVDDLKTYALAQLRRWNVENSGLLQDPSSRTEGLGDMILADYRE